jgi:hypothetical protein
VADRYAGLLAHRLGLCQCRRALEKEPAVPVNAIHDQYLELLFAHIERGAHPSHRFLDRVEASITDRATAERYANLLFELVEQQRHPSLFMIDRIGRVMAATAVADVMQEVDFP